MKVEEKLLEQNNKEIKKRGTEKGKGTNEVIRMIKARRMHVQVCRMKQTALCN